MTAISVPQRRVLADVVPGGLVRDGLLVLGGTTLIALCALVTIPQPFTPVPLSLQTFAVLLTGATLGFARGGLASLVYLLAGMAGVGWFAKGASGWHFASFGYIVGFVIAGALVGALASRGGDRTARRTVVTLVLGNLVIYAAGLVGLMAFVHVELAAAVSLGLTPFLLGDVIKIALAAGLLPAAWKLLGHVSSR